MKPLLQKLTLRERLLLAITLLAGTIAVLFLYVIRPAYQQFSDAASAYAVNRMELTELERNVSIGDQVNAVYQQVFVSDEEFSQASDHMLTSRFLREIEGVRSRFPSLALISATPQKVRDAATHKEYPVRMALAGKLPEIMAYVNDIGDQRYGAIRLEDLSLRTTQGVNMVESQFTLTMIRLLPHSGKKP